MLVQGELRNLQQLDLSHNKLTPPAAQQLVCGNWPMLHTLSLAATLEHDPNALQRANLSRTAKPYALYRKPEELSKTRQAKVTAACRSLGNSKWDQLTALDISWNRILEAGLAELVKGSWPRLEQIGVRSCLTSPEGSLQHFAAASWRCLTALDLSCNHLNEEDLQYLAAAKGSQLTRLEIGGGHCRPSCVPSMQAFWPTLKHLTLTTNSLDQVFALAMCPGQLLDTLNVSGAVNTAVQARPGRESWPINTHLNLVLASGVQILQSLVVGYWPVHSVAMFAQCSSASLPAALVQCDWSAIARFELQSRQHSPPRLELLCSGLFRETGQR